MKRLLLICLFPAVALANGNTPAPAPAQPTSSSQSSASAGAAAAAVAGAAAGAKSDQFQSQQQSVRSEASNAGNSQTTITSTERSAPPVIIPPAFPAVGCGRGVSLGGAGLSGGGAVAFNWAGKECELFARNVAFAQAFAAIGMTERACEVLMHHPLAVEVWPDMPSCRIVQPAVASPLATKEEVQQVDEKIDRVFRTVVAK